MTYHTNHSWCNESNWDNKTFFGEAMVYFRANMQTYSISSYEHKIPDPDWSNLIEMRKDFFDEKNYQDSLDFKRRLEKEFNKDFDESTFSKELFIKEGKYLKQEVIEWLNENVKDKIFADENTPLEDRKGWAIGNVGFRHKEDGVTIFFERQLDALKFIRKFSIFKEPTQYFDYFEDKQSIEMHPKKILDIINKHSNLNLDVNDFTFDKLQEKITQDMDYKYFVLRDWEKEDEDDEIDLNDEEKDLAIKEIYAIDEQLEEDNLEIER